MTQALGNRSILTKTVVILIYYVCAILSLYFNILAFVAFFGSIISHSFAKKDNEFIIAAHCTFIFRSYWISILLVLIILIAGFSLVGTSPIPIPDYFEFVNFEHFWNDMYVQSIIYYIIGIILGITLITLWFIYRMFKGSYALMHAKAPKNNL